ncbi:Plant organelle RNA recognition domain containing protein [Trema orientale]|uniref:Plant organelle RNA recognition domain containing protein n=1 Tax=Trema orientale TaxID=63057 RepID=A0A2P5EA29_TREOI|nr:Plant organelle RNA recognition domain containing protein [Trema orientale]
MAISLSFSTQGERPITFLNSDFLPRKPAACFLGNIDKIYKDSNILPNLSVSISYSIIKPVRSPCLDRHIVKQNKIRFVQKLKTLLLSKPKHYIPLHILSKCRSYLSLSTPKSILSMIRRYPTIFELFSIPWPAIPLNATKSYPQLCVRLTPAASALAAEELNYKLAISNTLARKLQKLLMLSSHQRLLLSKLVHLAPDLGLPPNFRSRLCNDHPDKFKTVDTSYGRALELVTWDTNLAKTLPLPSPDVQSLGLIVDRPLKFKQLRLRKGLNLKRRHQDFLLKFGEIPNVCPYRTHATELVKESIETEKRACAVVREVLGMTVEKRTLIDHLTHFRKEFGLSNKLRGMIIRHPELFYVSLKGQRDSVLLVEGYDEKGMLSERDKSLEIREQLMQLVREGKRMRRERKKAWINDIEIGDTNDDRDDEYKEDDHYDDEDDDDGFENLFESKYSYLDADHDESGELLSYRDNAEFWTTYLESFPNEHEERSMEPW